MKVLVTAASRHGATTEIAARIAEVLRTRGHVVQLQAPDDVLSLDGVGAVVVGSAVYTGRWLKPARHFAARFLGDLTGRKVWLFSSGPVGDPAFPHQPVNDLSDLVGRTGARSHAVFAGKLDTSVLGPVERLAVRAVRVAPGDYRNWAAVAAWATTIADTLDAEQADAHPETRRRQLVPPSEPRPGASHDLP
jgi:menaquinone-dependent protoporphyrinogen oxidase